MIRHRILPTRGQLLVSTDMHGNREDFEALEARFRALQEGGDVHWAVLGDVVHAPDAGARADRADLYDYDDGSAAIVQRLVELRAGDAEHVSRAREPDPGPRRGHDPRLMARLVARGLLTSQRCTAATRRDRDGVTDGDGNGLGDGVSSCQRAWPSDVILDSVDNCRRGDRGPRIESIVRSRSPGLSAADEESRAWPCQSPRPIDHQREVGELHESSAIDVG